MQEYYDNRAQEYDEWYLSKGLFAQRERPGWEQAVAELTATLSGLPPARTLDVACGTGFLTRHLEGSATGIDQSPRMLEIARRRVPGAVFVQGNGLELPFEDDDFDRVFTGHFYGHLQPAEREQFLLEARRVARELVVVDSARRPDHAAEELQRRTLNDGSSYEVFKRYFDPAALARELGDGEVLHASPWFVVVRSVDGARPGHVSR